MAMEIILDLSLHPSTTWKLVIKWPFCVIKNAVPDDGVNLSLPKEGIFKFGQKIWFFVCILL